MSFSRLTVLTTFTTLVALATFGSPVSTAIAGCSDGPGADVNWSDCRKRNLILRGSTLTGADLSETDLTSTDLRESKLDGANLTKANLLKSSLDGSTMIGANLSRAVGYRTRFHDTNLTNADFEKARCNVPILLARLCVRSIFQSRTGPGRFFRR